MELVLQLCHSPIACRDFIGTLFVRILSIDRYPIVQTLNAMIVANPALTIRFNLRGGTAECRCGHLQLFDCRRIAYNPGTVPQKASPLTRI